MKADELTLEELLAEKLPYLPEQDMYGLRPHGNDWRDALVNAGDIVVLKPMTTANEGDLVHCLVTLPGKTPNRHSQLVVIRHYHREGEAIRLKAVDPQYADMVLPTADVEVLGRVVASIRQF